MPDKTTPPRFAARVETTRLTPAEEAAFQQWARANNIPDVDSPQSRYDYRGYWRQHGNVPMRFGVDHFTDTYKQHGHPRFSAESKYSAGPWDGGRWIGENTLVAPPMPSHQRAVDPLMMPSHAPEPDRLQILLSMLMKSGNK